MKPFWKGPEVEGISFSLLSRFLTCRERFRVYVIEGLQPEPQFNHRIEFGNMWHLCEEVNASDGGYWDGALYKMCRRLLKKYPTQGEEVEKWYLVCKLQFPIYLEHYDTDNNVVLEQEQVFTSSYKLPSGRVVKLKGKRDKVFFVKKGKLKGVWLQEHKTKGEVDEEALIRQVTFDLQTMIYRISLESEVFTEELPSRTSFLRKELQRHDIRGVQYNVIRRPLSGGKGSIKQKQGSKNIRPETKDEYYKRVAKYITDEPETYFFRWDIDVTEQDIQKFKDECLDPILENLCFWYDVVVNKDPQLAWKAVQQYGYPTPHWRHPFGVTNFIDENGWQDVDHYLNTGDKTGLVEVETLFPELEGL